MGGRLKDELAARGGGFDCLLQAAEPDPAVSTPVTVSTRAQRPAERFERSHRERYRWAEAEQELLEGVVVAAGAAGGLVITR